MLAMVANDNAGCLTPSGVLGLIASMLAPTGGAPTINCVYHLSIQSSRAPRCPIDSKQFFSAPEQAPHRINTNSIMARRCPWDCHVINGRRKWPAKEPASRRSQRGWYRCRESRPWTHRCGANRQSQWRSRFLSVWPVAAVAVAVITAARTALHRTRARRVQVARQVRVVPAAERAVLMAPRARAAAPPLQPTPRTRPTRRIQPTRPIPPTRPIQALRRW